MSTHLSHELLQSALAGNLPTDDETALAQHLETCDSCSAELERLAGGADLCREAASLLTDDDLDAAMPIGEGWSEIDFVVEHLDPSDEPGVLGRLGGYDILEIIGRGGMGIVLKGFDRQLKRCVAVKVLAPHLARSSLARQRFAREAQAAAAVVHPHVLAIHQVQPQGRLPFLVMPLVAGQSLAERIAGQGALELKEILRIGMQAAAGLAAAHEQGLVHRDVKPANILLERGVERAVLTDFGLARAADDVALTRWGIIAGTPEYMSPEQARGEPLDARSDLFSLGSVMYQMASGVSPFRGDSIVATLRRLVDDAPQSLGYLNPELPPWLIAIIERLMEKDPARRFSSAKEVSQLLEGCLAHVQQPATVPLPPDLPRSARRTYLRSLRPSNRVLKGVVAMTSALAIGLACFLMLPGDVPDISGRWSGDDWGTVELKPGGTGEYTGTFSDSSSKGPGELELKWSRVERRFNGTWREGENRFGQISIRLTGEEIRGAFTTDIKSKLNPGTPALADLAWQRGGRPKNAVAKGDAKAVTTGNDQSASDATATHHPLLLPRYPKPVSEISTGFLVNVVAYSPDGKTLAIGGRLGVRLYDAHTGQPVAPPASKELVAGKEVSALAFSPDSRLVAVGHGVGLVSLFEVQTGKPVAKLDNHTVVNAVAFSPDGALLATGNPRLFAASDGGETQQTSDDGTLKLWDAKTGELKHDLNGKGGGSVAAVAFSPDGQVVVSAGQFAGDSAGVQLWNSQTGSWVKEFLIGSRTHVLSFSFSPEGSRLAIGLVEMRPEGARGAIWVYDPATGVVDHRLNGMSASQIAFSPDGAFIAAFGNPRSLNFWDASSGELGCTLVPPQNRKGEGWNCFAFAPEGERVAIGGLVNGKQGVRIWSWEEKQTASGQPAETAGPNEGNPSKVFQFSKMSATPALTIESEKPPKLIAYSPDGKTLATAGDGLTVELFDAQSGKSLAKVESISDEEQAFFKGDQSYVHKKRTEDWHVTALAFSPDSQLLAVANSVGPVKMFDARDGRFKYPIGINWRKNWEWHRSVLDGALSIAFSPDGSRLVTSGGGTEWVRLWDVDTGDLQPEITGEHNVECGPVAFSPDGKLLAGAATWTARNEPVRGVKFRDPLTGKVLKALRLDNVDGQITSVSFSSDSQHLLLGFPFYDINSDQTRGAFQLVQMSGGDFAPRSMTGVPQVTPVAYVPGRDNLIAYFHGASQLAIWNLGGEASAPAGAIAPPDSSSDEQWGCFAFVPTGNRVAIGGTIDGKPGVRIWDLAETAVAAGAADGPSGDTERLGELPASAVFSGDGFGLEMTGPVPSERTVGETAEFVIRVSNGAVPLADVVVADALGSELEPMQATAGFRWEKGKLTWTIDLLGPGETKAIRLVCKCIKPSAQVLNKVTATAGKLRSTAQAALQIQPAPAAIESVPPSDSGKQPQPEAAAQVTATPALTIESEKPPRLIAYSPDGRTLATAGDGTAVELFDAQSGEPLAKAESISKEELAAILSEGSPLRVIRISEASAAKCHVSALAFSPDSTLLAVGNSIGQVKLVGARDGSFKMAIGESRAKPQNDAPEELRRRIRFAHHDVASLAFSLDGNLLVSSGHRWGAIRLWNAKTGEAGPEIKGEHLTDGGPVAFSPDGNLLAGAATWSADGENVAGIKFRQRTGEVLGVVRLPGPNDRALSIGFSPDSTHLVYGFSTYDKGRDRTETVIQMIQAPSGGVGSAGNVTVPRLTPVAYSRDGKCLAAFVSESQLALWPAGGLHPGQTCMIELPTSTAKEKWDCFAFAPDGNRVAIGGTIDGKPGLRIWDLTEKPAPTEAQRSPQVDFAIGNCVNCHRREMGVEGVSSGSVAVDKALEFLHRAVLRAPNERPEAAATPPLGAQATVDIELSSGVQLYIGLRRQSEGKIDLSLNGLPLDEAGLKKLAEILGKLGRTPKIGMQTGGIPSQDIGDEMSRVTELLLGRNAPAEGEAVGGQAVGGQATVGGTPRSVTQIHLDAPYASVAFSPDDKMLAIGGSRDTIGLYQATTGEPIRSIKFLSDEEEAILASIVESNVPPGVQIKSMRVGAGVFSPDSSLLAATNSIGQVKLFDVQSGKLVRALDDVDRTTKDDKPLNKFLELPLAHEMCFGVAFSPDGSLLATCGNPIDRVLNGQHHFDFSNTLGLLKIWDVKTGKLKHDLSGAHNQMVSRVAFSADGKLLASLGSWQSTQGVFRYGVKFWDPAAAKVVQVVGIPDGDSKKNNPWSFALSPDAKHVAIGTSMYDQERSSGQIQLRSVETGLVKQRWLLNLPVTQVAFSFDGKSLVARSGENTLTLWDPSTAEPQHIIATGLREGMVTVWDAPGDTGRVDRRQQAPFFPPNGTELNTFDLGSKSNRVAIGGVDAQGRGVVSLLDLDAAPVVGNSSSQSEGQTGELPTSSSDDATIEAMLTSCAGGEPLRLVVQATPGGEAGVYWHGRLLADATLKKLAEKSAALPEIPKILLETEKSVPYGKVLEAINLLESLGLKKISLATLKKSSTDESAAPVPAGAETSKAPDAQSVLSRLSKSPPDVEIFADQPATAFASSDDGKLLAVAGEEGVAKLYDAETGQQKVRMSLLSDDDRASLEKDQIGVQAVLDTLLVTAPAFSPDGRQVAFGSSIGQAKLFDVETGKLLFALDDSGGEGANDQPARRGMHLPFAHSLTRQIVFSPDGTLVATQGLCENDENPGPAHGEASIKLWDAKTGKLLHDLKADDPAQVLAIAFSPNGGLLASASQWLADGEAGSGVEFWDPKSGKRMKTFQAPAIGSSLVNPTALALAWSPDGKRLAVGEISAASSLNLMFRFLTRDAPPQETKMKDFDYAIVVIDPVSGEIRCQLDKHLPAAFQFSPDGESLMAYEPTEPEPRRLDLLDAATGELRRAIDLPGDAKKAYRGFVLTRDWRHAAALVSVDGKTGVGVWNEAQTPGAAN